MSLDTRWIMVALVILIFMIVTVGHVAEYAGSFENPGQRWLGLPYALAVDVAIGLCAWFTRWDTTKKWAWIGYFSFVSASGLMNLAAIKPWNLGAPDWFFAGIYALFPTVAIGLLGFLARQAEIISEKSTKKRGLAGIFSRGQQISKRSANSPKIFATIPQIPANPGGQGAQIPNLGKARIRDWRKYYRGLNGDGQEWDPRLVAQTLTDLGYTPPSPRSLQDWAKEANEIQAKATTHA